MFPTSKLSSQEIIPAQSQSRTSSSKLASLFDDDPPVRTRTPSLQFVAPKQPQRSGSSTPTVTSETKKESPVILAVKVEGFLLQDNAFSSVGSRVCCIVTRESTPLFLLYHNPKNPNVKMSLNNFKITVQTNECAWFLDSHGRYWSVKSSEEQIIHFIKQVTVSKAYALYVLSREKGVTSVSLSPEVQPKDTHSDCLQMGDWAEISLTMHRVTKGVLQKEPISDSKRMRVSVSNAKEDHPWQSSLCSHRAGMTIFVVTVDENSVMTAYQINIEKIKKKKIPSQLTPQECNTSPSPNTADELPPSHQTVAPSHTDAEKTEVVSRIAKIGQNVFGANQQGSPFRKVERKPSPPTLDVENKLPLNHLQGAISSHPPSRSHTPILSPLIFNSTPIPASSFRPISVPPNHSTPTSAYPDHGHPQAAHHMFGVRGSESVLASYFSESRQHNTDVKMTLSRITDQMSDLQLKLCELQSSDKLRGGNSAAAIGFYAKVEDSLKQIGKISEQESSKQSSSTSLREDSGDLSVLFYQIKQLQQSLEEYNTDTSVRSVSEVVRFLEGLVTKSYKGQLRIVMGSESANKNSDELEVLKRRHQKEIEELTNQLRDVKEERRDLMNGKEGDRYYAEECVKMHRNLFGESESHWFDNYTALHKAYTSTVNANKTQEPVTNTENSSQSILVDNLYKEIDALKERNALLQSENSKLCTLSKDFESQKESVVNERQRVITLSATNERLEKELKEQNLETLATSSNSKKVEELQGLVVELNKKVSDKDSELSCLMRKVQEKDAELLKIRDVKQREIKEKDEALAELNESRAEVETELMEISGAQQSMEKEVEFLRQQLRRLLSLRKNQSAKTEQSIQTVASGPVDAASSPVDVVSVALRKVMNAVFKDCRGHFHDSTDFNGGNVKSFLLNAFRVYTLQYVDSLKKSEDLSRSSNGFENHNSSLDESKNASFPNKESCTKSVIHDNVKSNKNDTREDSLAENGNHEDSSATNGNYEDSSATNGNYEDSSATNGNHEDSSATNGNHEDSSATNGNHEDSSATNGNHEDSSTVNQVQEDSSTVNQVQEDSSTVNQAQEDSSTVNQVQEDSSTVNQVQEDSSTENQAQEDSSTENQVPEDSSTENQVPEDSSTENQVPEDSSTENQVPEDSSTENQVPEDSSTENQVPEDSSTENQVPEDSSTENQVPEDSSTENQVPEDSSTVNQVPEDSSTVNQVPVDSSTDTRPRNDFPAENQFLKGSSTEKQAQVDSPTKSEDRENFNVVVEAQENCNKNTSHNISPSKQHSDLVTYQSTSPDKFTESVLDNLSSPSQSTESSRNLESSNRTSSCEDFSSGDMTLSLPSDMNKIHGSAESVIPPQTAPTITHAASEPFIESNANDSSVDSTKSSKKEKTEQAKWPTLMEAQPPPLPLFSDDEEDDWLC